MPVLAAIGTAAAAASAGAAIAGAVTSSKTTGLGPDHTGMLTATTFLLQQANDDLPELKKVMAQSSNIDKQGLDDAVLEIYQNITVLLGRVEAPLQAAEQQPLQSDQLLKSIESAYDQAKLLIQGYDEFDDGDVGGLVGDQNLMTAGLIADNANAASSTIDWTLSLAELVKNNPKAFSVSGPYLTGMAKVNQNFHSIWKG